MSDAANELTALEARVVKVEAALRELGSALKGCASERPWLAFDVGSQGVTCALIGDGGKMAAVNDSLAATLLWEALRDVQDLILETAQEKAKGLVATHAKSLQSKLAEEKTAIIAAEKALKAYL